MFPRRDGEWGKAFRITPIVISEFLVYLLVKFYWCYIDNIFPHFHFGVLIPSLFFETDLCFSSIVHSNAVCMISDLSEAQIKPNHFPGQTHLMNIYCREKIKTSPLIWKPKYLTKVYLLTFYNPSIKQCALFLGYTLPLSSLHCFLSESYLLSWEPVLNTCHLQSALSDHLVTIFSSLAPIAHCLDIYHTLHYNNLL